MNTHKIRADLAALSLQLRAGALSIGDAAAKIDLIRSDIPDVAEAMKPKPTLYIVLQGGVVHPEVFTNHVAEAEAALADIVIVDYDIEGADPTIFGIVVDGRGRTHPAHIGSATIVQQTMKMVIGADDLAAADGLPVNDADVAEWTGLHYGLNFDTLSPEKRGEMRARYLQATF